MGANFSIESLRREELIYKKGRIIEFIEGEIECLKLKIECLKQLKKIRNEIKTSELKSGLHFYIDFHYNRTELTSFVFILT